MRIAKHVSAEAAVNVTVFGLLLVGLIAYPPQRRVGDWSRADCTRLTYGERYQLDRIWFGYLPTFQSVSKLASTASCGAAITYQSAATGSCQIQTYRWGIDWLWMVFLISLLNGAALLAYRSLHKREPTSHSR